MREAGGWRLEEGGWELEAGGWRREDGSLVVNALFTIHYKFKLTAADNCSCSLNPIKLYCLSVHVSFSK